MTSHRNREFNKQLTDFKEFFMNVSKYVCKLAGIFVQGKNYGTLRTGIVTDYSCFPLISSTKHFELGSIKKLMGISLKP